MSWLDRKLLGEPRTELDAPLDVDLETLALAGLTRGALRETIERRLGPPSSYALRRRGRLEYPHLGVYVAMEGKRLSGYDLMIRVYEPGPPTRDLRRPFVGVWLPGPQQSPPSLETLSDRFGEPTVKEADYELTEYTWRSTEWLVAAEFDDEGQLWAFMVDFG